MPLEKQKTKKQWRSSFLFVRGLFGWGAGGYAHIHCRGLVCGNCCFSSRTFFAESFLCSMLLQKQATALFFFKCILSFSKKKKKRKEMLICISELLLGTHAKSDIRSAKQRFARQE